MIYIAVFSALLVGVLSACTKEAFDPVQTVDWYKSHDNERTAMLAKCANDPGRLGITPNCINADKARTALMFDAKGRSAFDTLNQKEVTDRIAADSKSQQEAEKARHSKPTIP